MPLYIAQSGDLDRCYRCLTDRLTTLKDRATQLLIKYKSGALVTQYELNELFQISKQSSRKWPLKAWKGGHQKLEPFYSQRKLPSFQIITPPVDLTLPFPKDFSSKLFALNLFLTL